jgi:hypothetical protein
LKLDKDKKEQDIRFKMIEAVIGVEGFREKIERRVVDARRPRRGGHRK